MGFCIKYPPYLDPTMSHSTIIRCRAVSWLMLLRVNKLLHVIVPVLFYCHNIYGLAWEETNPLRGPPLLKIEKYPKRDHHAE